MSKTLFSLFIAAMTALLSLPLHAQSADKIYRQGKQLYDAGQYSEAVPLLKTAADKGHKKALYRLGRCYAKGNGVEKDLRMAFAYYSKAAEQNYHKAQYRMGKCYKDGKGVQKDKKKAFHYFQLAANQEYADAEYQLGKCYFKGKGTDADKSLAKKWLLRAVRNPKGGDDILRKLRTDASAGDEDAKAMLQLIGKAKH